MYQTYILYSQTKDRYYIGATGVGVKLRLVRHNEGWTRSTKSGIPWGLKYVRSFNCKSEALKWEKHIKGQKSRKFIEGLIHSKEEHKHLLYMYTVYMFVNHLMYKKYSQNLKHMGVVAHQFLRLLQMKLLLVREVREVLR